MRMAPGAFFLFFFLPILRIVYYKFYMGEEGVKSG